MIQHQADTTQTLARLIGIADILVGLLTIYVLQYIFPYDATLMHTLPDAQHATNVIISLCIVAASAYAKPTVVQKEARILPLILQATSQTALLLLISSIALWFFQDTFPKLFPLLCFCVLYLCLLLCERFLIRHFIRRLYTHGYLHQNLLYAVPSLETGIKQRLYELSQSPTTAVIFAPQEAVQSNPALRLYNPDDIDSFLTQNPQTTALIYLHGNNLNAAQDIAQLQRISDKFLLPLYVQPNHDLGPEASLLPLINNHTCLLQTRSYPLDQLGNRLLKRCLDISLSLLLLLTIYPVVYLVVFIFVKLQSPGPVYFTQKRSGYKGRIFTCIKFRSMHPNTQSDTLQACPEDPRIYAFGRFMRNTNIDELPQIINILRGEMSFIGPRPHMLLHTRQYSTTLKGYMLRHMAKPGLSGWAQVKGYSGAVKNDTLMQKRIDHDLWYIANYSPALDLRIMIQTLWNILTRKPQKNN